jgi:hypothetical protein
VRRFRLDANEQPFESAGQLVLQHDGRFTWLLFLNALEFDSASLVVNPGDEIQVAIQRYIEEPRRVIFLNILPRFGEFASIDDLRQFLGAPNSRVVSAGRRSLGLLRGRCGHAQS